MLRGRLGPQWVPPTLRRVLLGRSQPHRQQCYTNPPPCELGFRSDRSKTPGYLSFKNTFEALGSWVQKAATIVRKQRSFFFVSVAKGFNRVLRLSQLPAMLFQSWDVVEVMACSGQRHTTPPSTGPLPKLFKSIQRICETWAV